MSRRRSLWFTQYTLLLCMHARALSRRPRAATDACAIVFSRVYFATPSTHNTTDTVTLRKYDRPSRHASQPDGACKEAHTNSTPTTEPLVPRGIIAHDTETITTARTRQLTYSLRRHRSAPCRNICPMMRRAGWKQPSIIMPRPVSRPPDEHHTTTMNNHARIQWVGSRPGGRTNRRTRERMTCMGAATNVYTQRKVRSQSASGLNHMQ